VLPVTVFADRAFARSMGASCVLHGAIIVLLVLGWRIERQQIPALKPIPVTLVKTDETAPPTLAIPAAKSAAIPTEPPASVTAPEPPQRSAAARTLPCSGSSPSHHAAAALPANQGAQPAHPSVVKPSDDITALIAEGVDGRPLTATRTQSQTGIRSSAPVSDDYLVQLATWLARFQNYPAAAAANHQEGKNIIGFTVARDGTVRRVWVDQSSGVPALDDASVGMIRAASPVPALPQDLTGASVDFFFPVNYGLSTFQRLFR
jgi:protein TonB